jgi:hypothetical protein
MRGFAGHLTRTGIENCMQEFSWKETTYNFCSKTGLPIILSRVPVRLYAGFGLVIGFGGHLQNVTTSNYDSLTELHTPKITVTTANTRYKVF